MRLLLVEDETRLAASLKRGLEEEGFVVDVAHDGEQGYEAISETTFDMIIVDWRLPGMDGQTLIRRLREEGKTLPILMLTALGGIDHKVAGLNAGADDYLTKPFAFEELVARLRALARRDRRAPAVKPWLQCGDLEMDTLRRQVRVQGNLLDLWPKEYALLEELMRSPDKPLTRTVLAERVWGSALYVTDNVIDVTISRLRSKLADAFRSHQTEQPIQITTIRGVGYRLRVGDEGR